MSLNIKEMRTKLNLTQGELSLKTGIPRDRIAKWEQGKGSPKAEDYVLLQNLMGEELPTKETPVQTEDQGEYRTLYIQSLLEQKRILEEQNLFLRRNFEISLNSIVKGQDAVLLQLKTISWFQVDTRAGGDQKKAAVLMERMGKKANELAGISEKKEKGGIGISADFYSLKHLNTDETAAILGLQAAMRHNGHTSASTTMIYAIGQKDRELEELKKVGNTFA